MCNIDSLVQSVQNAFEEVQGKTILKTFVTLKEVMTLVISNEKDNYFKLPHSKKNSRKRKGENKETVYCGEELANKGRAFPARESLKIN